MAIARWPRPRPLFEGPGDALVYLLSVGSLGCGVVLAVVGLAFMLRPVLVPAGAGLIGFGIVLFNCVAWRLEQRAGVPPLAGAFLHPSLRWLVSREAFRFSLDSVGEDVSAAVGLMLRDWGRCLLFGSFLAVALAVGASVP